MKNWNEVILSLEKGKELDKEWKEKNLNLLINNFINIENNIKIIEKVNEKINESNKLYNMTIEFHENKDYELFKKIIWRY